MTAAHAPLACSAADLWGHCSGYLAMCAQVPPKTETEDTRNGVAVHWVEALVLTSYLTAGMSPLTCGQFVGQVAPNGVVIDHDHVEGAQVYVLDVLREVQRYGAMRLMRIEERLAPSRRIHPHNWGTPDLDLRMPNIKKVVLWDYKNGRRGVRARGNLQMTSYLAGIADELGLDGHADQQWSFEVRIVQPHFWRPSGAVDVWEGKFSDLRLAVNQLRDKAVEAFSAPTLTAGPWCRDCPAVGTCPAAAEAVAQIIDAAERPMPLAQMSDRALGVEYRLMEQGRRLVDAYAEAVEETLKYRISQGSANTGYSLQVQPGRLTYTVPDAQAIAFAQLMGVDNSVVKALTPKQTLTATPAEKRPAMEMALQHIAARAPGSAKLIPVTDTVGARVFSSQEDV